MSLEDNKKLVLGFFENLSAGNMDAFFGALSENLTWWIQGNLEFSGTKTKAEIVKLFPQVAGLAEGNPRMTPKGITAEGDRVAIEVASYAKLKNGRIIQNTYHFLFVVRDGKIESVREYFDTHHMSQVLFG